MGKVRRNEEIIVEKGVIDRKNFFALANIWRDVCKEIVEIKMSLDDSVEDKYIKMILENGTSLKDAIESIKQSLVVHLRENGTTAKTADVLKVSRKTIERISKRRVYYDKV